MVQELLALLVSSEPRICGSLKCSAAFNAHLCCNELPKRIRWGRERVALVHRCRRTSTHADVVVNLPGKSAGNPPEICPSNGSHRNHLPPTTWAVFLHHRPKSQPATCAFTQRHTSLHRH